MLNKEKIGKLDDLLLVLAPSVSILLSVIGSIATTKWIIYFLPGLIPTFAIPIYVGYIKGAILDDSLEKRVQGWIYFISGFFYYTASYVYLYCSEIAAKIYGQSPLPGTVLIVISLVTIAIIIILTTYAVLEISKKIFKICGQRFGPKTHRKLVLLTLARSLSLVGACYSFALFLGAIINLTTTESWYIITTIVSAFLLFIAFKVIARFGRSHGIKL